jgi:flagellar basal-body rod protein FlgB
MLKNQLLFDTSFQTLEKAVGITQQRHGVIANNISNMDTPGFKAKDVDFKDALKSAMGDSPEGSAALTRTDAHHMGTGIGPGGVNGLTSPVETFEEKGIFDGLNWVNMDSEMQKLTENKLVYRSAVEAMLRKISTIKEVIKEGGR